MTSMWRIDDGKLRAVSASMLGEEKSLEDWIEHDPGLIDPGLIVIGRQVETIAGRLDLLGLTSDGDLVVIELKRDKTPRDVVAQVLDYASWASRLEASRILQIASSYSEKRNLPPLFQRFRDAFGTSLPETLNTTHRAVIVAGSIDASSKRIVEYLSETYKMSINTAFFNVFEDRGASYLVADWLLDQEVVEDRATDRVRTPWSGKWYVNVGEGQNRAWEDMRRFGFVAAGAGRIYSDQLERLSVGDQLYAYQKGRGYVGAGEVIGSVVPAREFLMDGAPLEAGQLKQPALLRTDNPDYVVPVRWKKTFSFDEAKTFAGAFANPNIVCKLRDPATLDYLEKEFG